MGFKFVTGTHQSPLVIQTKADNWVNSNRNANIYISEDLTMFSKGYTKIIQVPYSSHLSKRTFPT